MGNIDAERPHKFKPIMGCCVGCPAGQSAPSDAAVHQVAPCANHCEHDPKWTVRGICKNPLATVPSTGTWNETHCGHRCEPVAGGPRCDGDNGEHNVSLNCPGCADLTIHHTCGVLPCSFHRQQEQEAQPDPPTSEPQAKYMQVIGPNICIRCSFETDKAAPIDKQNAELREHLDRVHPGWELETLENSTIIESRYQKAVYAPPDQRVASEPTLYGCGCRLLEPCDRHRIGTIRKALEACEANQMGQFNEYIHVRKSDWEALVEAVKGEK